MGTKSAVPILLLVLANTACRSAALSSPLAAPVLAPEEFRLYEVDDVLDRLAGVPRRGCCVLPFPTTQVVVFPVAWAAAGRPLERTAERQRELEIRAANVAEEARLAQLPRISDAYPSSYLAEPSEALLDHLRNRHAAREGSPVHLRLAMRGGTTLEARGAPAALEKVERALADLR